MKKTLFLLFILCSVLQLANAADKVITGNVIAADDKQPLIGVSVFVSSEDLKNQVSNFVSMSSLPNTTAAGWP